MRELQEILQAIATRMSARSDRGAVASYIPQLANVDPRQFGIAVVDVEGEEYAAGDAETPFSIQSISKVFALTLALEKCGESLWSRVQREPSGNAFNSIVQLEHEAGIPRNPFVNAGAIVVSDALLTDREPSEAHADIVRFIRLLAGDEEVFVDPAVVSSETKTGFRNAALANFMRAYGNLHHDPATTLNVYFHQCAVAMSCQQLARAGRYLAFDGCLSPGGRRIVSSERARRINALMLTCGHYDGSGDFAFRVGLPGKSGVGGGILAIAPSRSSIAVWSPGLNEVGNSHLGSQALEELANAVGWSVFGPADAPSK